MVDDYDEKDNDEVDSESGYHENEEGGRMVEK